MKRLILSWLLAVLFLSTTNAQYGAHRTGYEGDFFSLEGAIELFHRSNSIRNFERRINTEDNWVNNLDLNYDGRIDYIRVDHRRYGDYHAIVLQVPIDRYDVQDVAVIEIEKTGRREAILQIVGDEDLYGEEVIVEPTRGRNRKGFVNVYRWPAVQHIFCRSYRQYSSPYSWRYYPTWWRPWRPCGWNTFRPRIAVYHTNYHVVHVHRVPRVHHFYKPNRVYCERVVRRSNKVRIKHGKKPVYRSKVKKRNKHNGHQKEVKKVDRKRRHSHDKTVEARDRTNQNRPRSRNQVEQKRNNKPSTSRAKTKDKVSQRAGSNRQQTTPKVNRQRGNASRNHSGKRSAPKANKQRGNKTKSHSGSRSNTARSPSKRAKPSAPRSKSAPSSGKKVSRNKTTSQKSVKSKRGN